MPTSEQVIGFIGIGAMGAPMAAHLVKAGYKLVIYDADAGRMQTFSSMHEVEVARNPSDVGVRSGTVITMLPDGKIVRRVICGENDSYRNCVAADLKAGATVIDMSSSSPVGTRELGLLLEKRGVNLLDAPVSGGVKRAASAELAIMVGGDEALFAHHRSLFDKLG